MNNLYDLECSLFKSEYLCNEEYLIEMARKDNDINVLSIGARVIDFEKAKKIIDMFFII